jgi:hypothetical protein
MTRAQAKGENGSQQNDGAHLDKSARDGFPRDQKIEAAGGTEAERGSLLTRENQQKKRKNKAPRTSEGKIKTTILSAKHY